MDVQWSFRVAVVVLSIAGLCLSAEDARAQAYPNKAITVIIPYGPGSGNDLIGRIVAQKVTESWGHPMVVSNRPGAAGVVGLVATAKAAPDGYTIVVASTSQIIYQHAAAAAPYDITRDFAPVSRAGTIPQVLVVPSSLPAKSLKELVAMAKSRPGKLNYAGQIGSIPHFMGEMLKSAAGIDIRLVTYKGNADAEVDVIAGRVEIWFASVASVFPHVKSGKLRVLGVGGEKRAAVLPEAPTMVEAGFPALDVSAQFVILAPAGTPKPIVAALNGEIVKAIGAKDVRDRIAAAGIEPRSSSPEELDTLVRSEVARWGRIVKQSGIRVQ